MRKAMLILIGLLLSALLVMAVRHRRSHALD